MQPHYCRMIRFMMTTFLAGMGTGGSLIIAIGAQNAFVLTKGIQRHHHIASGLTCSLIDAVLIGAGVLGMGRLVEQIPLLLPVVTLGGALFLFIYGILSLYSAVRVQEGMRTRGEAQGGRKQVILTNARYIPAQPPRVSGHGGTPRQHQHFLPATGELHLCSRSDIHVIHLVLRPDPCRKHTPSPCSENRSPGESSILSSSLSCGPSPTDY